MSQIIKVGLLGNTCNNNFSLLRYLRDLGVDAHLFLFSNEGEYDLNRINSPERDTWNFPRWQDFIHTLPFPNGIETIVGRPDLFKVRPSTEVITNAISSCNFFVGSGIAPAIFARLHRRLDIFYPYSTGVEWVGDEGTLHKLNQINLQLPFRLFVRDLQIKGIQQSRLVLSHSTDSTLSTLKSINVEPLKYQIPIIYNKESIPTTTSDPLLITLSGWLTDSAFVVFSHMRHHWVFEEDSYQIDSWNNENKHNDWLIHGFSRFLQSTSLQNPKLVLVEWGQDVAASKRLCVTLSISQNVIWLPLLARKQIYWIIKHLAHISTGDFVTSKGTHWGSTAYEAISLGAPVMQSICFSSDEYKAYYDQPLPFLFDVHSVDDVVHNLKTYTANPEKYTSLFSDNLSWFNTYNGESLARQLIECFF